MTSKPYAIIAGVGAGTGAAVARRFAKQYPVALLARSPDFSHKLAAEIEAEGGTAVSYKVDVANEEDMERVFGEIKDHFGSTCAAAVFNASSRPFPKPFLWQTQGDMDHALNITLHGAYLFAKLTLPLLLNAKGEEALVPTLLYTGATAGVKANAWLQPFAVSKHALRALVLALADEFAPQGVHVAHAIIDGVIRMPLTWVLKPLSSWHAKLDPTAIADSYWHLHQQPLAHSTAEIALRPFCETW
ncbi:oxidoreductase, short chain dehydrogenase/reductase family [Cordyceps fumosorosea ARSEF 2679]|uniref:Oxidoreductase, short chain dehydrogenase/reductase family n=1 Tax=Cordyceps fumosorosea (strain ARSEF 2679) TaxID=1081104 RepID=A0A167UBG0_CORFA|nr:oxidoreductase, short chain dehydrogenase/reductase family [Cordyceps fumosorosea ARSEF 2679]OAA61416.1 oxidoreductase, short chain dehydrogenase/reductase family [Cordyceps fumosorosea ARSEF 2679]